jgi:hypothetical protein
MARANAARFIFATLTGSRSKSPPATKQSSSLPGDG